MEKANSTRFFRIPCVILTLLLCGIPSLFYASSGQTKAVEDPSGDIRRLILKDGSYELISRYEVAGDRVRYFSSERHAWEELPNSMIDWPATQAYAAQASHSESARKSDALEKAAADRREDDSRYPLVAPGVRLPAPEWVYLLDEYENQPALNRLAQNGADINKNTGSNILRGVINPIAGSKQTVELKGLNSRIQSHVRMPSVYFAVDPGDPQMGYTSETAKNHLRIVRCENKKGNRIVATISIAIYGKVKQKANYVETKVEPVSEYWAKVTPAAPLQTGEYALVELDEKGSLNQYVWDFGVNPAAPPNPPALLSEPVKGEPVLIEKPRKKPNS